MLIFLMSSFFVEVKASGTCNLNSDVLAFESPMCSKELQREKPELRIVVVLDGGVLDDIIFIEDYSSCITVVVVDGQHPLNGNGSVYCP